MRHTKISSPVPHSKYEPTWITKLIRILLMMTLMTASATCIAVAFSVFTPDKILIITALLSLLTSLLETLNRQQ